jgi:hypothetical protein
MASIFLHYVAVLNVSSHCLDEDLRRKETHLLWTHRAERWQVVYDKWSSSRTIFLPWGCVVSPRLTGPAVFLQKMCCSVSHMGYLCNHLASADKASYYSVVLLNKNCQELTLLFKYPTFKKLAVKVSKVELQSACRYLI